MTTNSTSPVVNSVKKLLVLSCCFLPLSSFAAEFEFSVGAGYQYSGVIGTQFAMKTKQSKYFVSVGLPGASVGMQTVLFDNDHHSMGFSVGRLQEMVADGDQNYGFITYNYHFSGFANSGWVLGAGVGVYDEQAYTPLFSNNQSVNPPSKAMITLDIGYKF